MRCWEPNPAPWILLSYSTPTTTAGTATLRFVIMSNNNFVDSVSKINEIPTKGKPTFKVRINPDHNANPTTLKDLSDQINALQRSIAYITYKLSKLDYFIFRTREQGHGRGGC
jgi:hypothetical protein